MEEGISEGHVRVSNETEPEGRMQGLEKTTMIMIMIMVKLITTMILIMVMIIMLLLMLLFECKNMYIYFFCYQTHSN